MIRPDWKGPLGEAFDQSLAYLEGLPGRSPAPTATAEQLRAALGGPLPDEGTDPAVVVVRLARDVDPGPAASGSGRYFGFVIGGTLPAALAADWLATAWDQNAGLYATSPAASVVEEVTARWLADLFGLSPQVAVGFVTGAQMATFTGLSVGLRVVLQRHGWDLAAEGLRGSPPVRVFAGTDRHGTVDRALRLLGLGTAVVEPVPPDTHGRLDTAALADVRADPARARGDPPGGGRADEPRDRPRALPQPTDGGDARQQRHRQARRPLPGRCGAPRGRAGPAAGVLVGLVVGLLVLAGREVQASSQPDGVGGVSSGASCRRCRRWRRAPGPYMNHPASILPGPASR
jgi:hypothetical protein